MTLILPNPSVHGDKAPIPLASAQEWDWWVVPSRRDRGLRGGIPADSPQCPNL